MPDGVYMVNCVLNGEERSGPAYYSQVLFDGGNDGQQPDAFTYVREGSFISWEGGEQSGVFNDGRKFDWIINSDWATGHLGQLSGTATNGLRDFQVFRDSGALLVTTLDGFSAYKVYLCT